jgi:hypothetical protein
VLAPVGDVQPQLVAGPVHWAANLVAAHPVAWDVPFAIIQLAQPSLTHICSWVTVILGLDAIGSAIPSDGYVRPLTVDKGPPTSPPWAN